MPNITIITGFKFAERGIDVIEYVSGETVDVSEECAEVALAEGWAQPEGADVSAKKKKKPEAQIIDETFEQRETASANAEQLELK